MLRMEFAKTERDGRDFKHIFNTAQWRLGLLSNVDDVSNFVSRFEIFHRTHSTYLDAFN